MTRGQTALFLTWMALAATSLILAIAVLAANGHAGAGWAAGFGLGVVVCLLGVTVTTLAARVLQHHEDHCEAAYPGYRRRTPRRAVMPAQHDRDLDDLDAMLDATKEDPQ